jgi:hypothetical protein
MFPKFRSSPLPKWLEYNLAKGEIMDDKQLSEVI